MELSALNNPNAGLQLAQSREADAEAAGFERQLEQLKQQFSKKRQEVREGVEQFVAFAFVKPMFDMLRNDPFKSDLLHGGYGEDVFAQELHVHWRNAITSSPKFPLVDELTDSFVGQAKNIYERAARKAAQREVDTHG
jgi:hypothetical protein